MTRSSRIVAVDVFRGLTIAGMLVVNNPGNESQVLVQAAHSAWHGCTIADLVFPAFLVVLGVTTQLSLARADVVAHGVPWRAVLRRAGWLVLAGLLLNAYPFFEKHAVAGPAWFPAPLAHVTARLASLRFTGVLQRLGVVYLATVLVVRACPPRVLVVVTASLLAGYGLLLTLVPAPGMTALGPSESVLGDAARTLPVWLDHQLLDWERWGLGWHLWDRARAYDPEGILSTLGALGTTLLGVLAGRELTADRALPARARRLAMGGLLLSLVGLAWSVVLPLNKPLWTSSYALYSAGIAWIGLAVTTWLSDVRAQTRWTAPWLVFGTNPLVVYIGSELLASILRSSIKWRVDGRLVSTGRAVSGLFEGAGVPPAWASLAWSLLFTCGCWLAVRPLYRRGTFLSL